MKKDMSLSPVVVPSMGVKKSRRAVSPVVGVMLMLIATVIIAAAVHSYASSLATTSSKAPSGTWDVKIKNSGYYADSGIWLTYLSGDPVPSKDIKIVMIHENNITEAIPNTNNVKYINKNTSAMYTITDSGAGGATSINVSVKVSYNDGAFTEPWADATVTLANSTNANIVNGTTDSSGWFNATIPGGWNAADDTYNITIEVDPETAVVLRSPTFQPTAGDSTVTVDYTGTGYKYSGPVAYVNDTWTGWGVPPYDIRFGNYTIETGVMLKASPNWNYDNYQYGLYKGKYVAEGTEPTEALLKDWQWVRPGDTVTVEIVHIPSGKTIYKADILVEG